MSNRNNINPNSARKECVIFSELEAICISPGYIHAIAYFCWRDNLIQYSGEQVTSDDFQHQHSNDKLARTEISTLIGLMAKNKIETTIPAPDVLQSYIEGTEKFLYELHMCLQQPWFESFKLMAKNPKKAKLVDPFDSAEGLREPIFYSGEAAYSFQYANLALQKYQADNEWLLSNKGFTIQDACHVCDMIGDLQSQRLIGFREPMKKLPPDQWTFLPGFVFTVDELVEVCDIDRAVVECILDAFCFDAKSNNSSFMSLSDFNETNATPIVRVCDDTLILLQHYSLLEALYETPFFWMAGDKKYSGTASKNRGQYTEQFIYDRLLQVFGKNHVLKNIDIYHGKQRTAEADILVLYGDRALVFQAKSKRLTIEARKGNDSQLKDDFKKAIQDAYDQSVSCSKALLDTTSRFVDAHGNEVSISNQPKTIFPMCVVSDHYPALAAQTRQFLKTQTQRTIQPPIVTDVFFVDVLAEILETPLHLLNYLALRSKFSGQLLVSQEMTSLGYHLKHNLWLEDKWDMVNLGDDLASDLDIAMLARRTGVSGEKTPKGILTRFIGTPIGRLLEQIENSGKPELVGLGMLFLQLSSEAAKHINNGIDSLVSAAARHNKHHDFSVPFETGNVGFTVHINSRPEAEARNLLNSHCKMRKYITKSDAWYGLLLVPGSGEIKAAIVIEDDWTSDKEMEGLAKKWPQKPMLPLSKLTSSRKRKIGRNEPCPCGKGKKYKKCCLHNGVYEN